MCVPRKVYTYSVGVYLGNITGCHKQILDGIAEAALRATRSFTSTSMSEGGAKSV